MSHVAKPSRMGRQRCIWELLIWGNDTVWNPWGTLRQEICKPRLGITTWGGGIREELTRRDSVETGNRSWGALGQLRRGQFVEL